MKKRLMRAGYALAFLAVCAGTLWFLQRFTQAESAFVYPAWETGAVVSAAGQETPIDPLGTLPGLEEGETYRFTLTLPAARASGTYLIFETAGLEAAAFLDGTELWYSAAEQSPETVNQSQAHIPLPAGGGETLTVDLRPLAEGAIVPPILRLSADPADQAGTVAYANYYGLPAGASALALALLWGLFLLGLARGKRNWLLLLPILAAAALTVQRLATGYGSYFLPQAVWELCVTPWLERFAALALVLYLVLCRDRAFWRTLGLTAAWSAGALAVMGLISHLRGGYLGPLPRRAGLRAGGGHLERCAVLADLVAGAGVRRPLRLGAGPVSGQGPGGGPGAGPEKQAGPGELPLHRAEAAGDREAPPRVRPPDDRTGHHGPGQGLGEAGAVGVRPAAGQQERSGPLYGAHRGQRHPPGCRGTGQGGGHHPSARRP